MALAAFAAACGGSSEADDPTTAAVALTKAEFIKQGDAICAKADKTQEADFKSYSQKHPEPKPTKSGQEKAAMAVGLPPIQSEAEELAELAAPKGDEERVAGIVAGIEKGLKKAEADPGSLLTVSEGPFGEVDKLAAAYGFKECDKVF